MTTEMDRRAELPARPALDEPARAVESPGPGVAVLACRCGRVLDLTDMHRRPLGHSAVIDPITCRSCT